ncbi:MAG: HAD-IA family hydrolase [Candidatus Nanoarchaeia archaeon]
MIDHIFWDMDGVLMFNDWDKIHVGIAEGLNMPYETFRKIVYEHVYDVITGRLTSPEIAQRFGADPDTFEAIYRNVYFAQHEINHTLLNRITQSPHNHGIISDTTYARSKCDAEQDLYLGFAPVFLSCDLSIRKPNAKIFEHALKHVDAPANRTVFIDDYARNAEAACNVGMHGIQYESNDQVLTDLKDLGINL